MKDYLEKIAAPSMEDGYRLIRQGAALIDGSGFGILKVTGENAAEALNALVTKDVQYLNIDTVSECLVLNEEACALGTVYVCHLDADFIVLTPPGSEQAAEKLASDLGESATDVSAKQDLVCIEGPKAWQVIRDVLKINVDMLPLRGIEEITGQNGSALYVMRIGRSGEYAYAILADAGFMPSLVEEMKTYGQNQGLAIGAASEDTMKVCMLETLQPDFSSLPTEEEDLFSLGLQWLIQYEKEDYCGHDAMKELFEKGHEQDLVFFTAKDRRNVEIGSEITLDSETVGKVVQAAVSPALGYVFGSALIRSDLAVTGVLFTLTDKDGECEIETVASPVIRPVSWDQPME